MRLRCEEIKSNLQDSYKLEMLGKQLMLKRNKIF